MNNTDISKEKENQCYENYIIEKDNDYIIEKDVELFYEALARHYNKPIIRDNTLRK